MNKATTASKKPKYESLQNVYFLFPFQLSKSLSELPDSEEADQKFESQGLLVLV